ncbi:MAG: heme biosynthesis HemY N-terminal domain-containing protein [Hyphomicrobiales bacterium]
MIRLVWTFLIIAGVAFVLTWFADNPGHLTIDWRGYVIELSVFSAVLLLAAAAAALWLLFWITLYVVGSPWALGSYWNARRTRRGTDALTNGLVAIGAGDLDTARREAKVASRVLGDSPLVKLLEAQSAQLAGNHQEVKQVFEGMLGDPTTELLGLRGLYAEAKRNGDHAKAALLAKRAAERNPGLTWASQALLAEAAVAADWATAETLLNRQRQNRLIDEKSYNRALASILTAQALAAEDTDEPKALSYALKANGLDPSLVPAAVVAGRRLSAQGSLRRARKVVEKTWALTPHPELGNVYAFARFGDGPLDRLKHVRALMRVSHGGEDGAVVHAKAAIDASEWQEARSALHPWTENNPSPRVCVLMAEIEDGQFADRGKVREWLSRALRGPQDPAWVDPEGYVSTEWLAASPVTGDIGRFEWRTPTSNPQGSAILDQLTQAMEALPSPAAAVPPPEPAPVEEEAPEAVAPEEPEETPPAPVEKPMPPVAAVVVADPVDVADDTAGRRAGFHQPDDPGPEASESDAGRRSWVARIAGG